MNWFSKDFIQFFRELEKNNTRDWFVANKKRYEAGVKEPFELFVGEIIMRVNKLDPGVKITPKEAVFRIAKDIRFSADKTPYKTFMAALVSESGRKGVHLPGLYFQIGSKGAEVFAGSYAPDKEALYRIREKIAGDLKGFSKIIGTAGFRTHFGEIRGEKNKRIQPEFAEAAASQPLLYNKGFYVMASIEASAVTGPKFADKVMELYRAARPLNEYLREPSLG